MTVYYWHRSPRTAWRWVAIEPSRNSVVAAATAQLEKPYDDGFGNEYLATEHEGEPEA